MKLFCYPIDPMAEFVAPTSHVIYDRTLGVIVISETMWRDLFVFSARCLYPDSNASVFDLSRPSLAKLPPSIAAYLNAIKALALDVPSDARRMSSNHTAPRMTDIKQAASNPFSYNNIPNNLTVDCLKKLYNVTDWALFSRDLLIGVANGTDDLSSQTQRRRYDRMCAFLADLRRRNAAKLDADTRLTFDGSYVLEASRFSYVVPDKMIAQIRDEIQQRSPIEPQAIDEAVSPEAAVPTETANEQRAHSDTAATPTAATIPDVRAAANWVVVDDPLGATGHAFADASDEEEVVVFRTPPPPPTIPPTLA